MKQDSPHELNVQTLSLLEQVTSEGITPLPADYKQAVIFLAIRKGLTTTPAQVMQEYKAGTWEAIEAEHPHRFVDGPGFVVDLHMNYIVTPADELYNAFFAYGLRNADLFELDSFLNYQLKTHHAGNVPAFVRFLVLLLRSYAGIIPEQVKETVNEWITAQNAPPAEQVAGKREKFTRRRDDQLTKLNQEQTVLLAIYLKEAGAFLRDDLLPATETARAFELLTGYSYNTLRQDIGKYFDFENKENLTKLQNLLNNVNALIEKRMPGKR